MKMKVPKNRSSPAQCRVDPLNVRFALDSGHGADMLAGPGSAMKRHRALSKNNTQGVAELPGVAEVPWQRASLRLRFCAGAFSPLKNCEVKLMRTIVFSLLALTTISIPAVGQAQKQPAQPPKPTLADVQKIVQMVNANKEKLQTYCELAKLNDQIAAADEKKDTKAVQALGERAASLVQKMGPEYAKVMNGLYQVDENSPLGKQIGVALEPLDKQCK
jgi:hypothetical protein